MSLLKALRARLRALVFRAAADAELNEEIRFHLDAETEKNVRLGMSRDEARRLALATFGGVQRVREDHRDVRRLQWIEDFFSDARHGLRGMRRAPTLFSAALLTIALGIAANVAIFSALNGVVLRKPPFPDPDRLMIVTEENPVKAWHLQVAAPANLFDWRAQVAAFEDAAGYLDGGAFTAFYGQGEPKQVNLSLVTGSFFTTLGVRPQFGETFRFQDSLDSTFDDVVISDRFWRDELGADPSIVGKRIRLGTNGGKLTRVLGIMPRGFSFPRAGIDVWQCWTWSPSEQADVSFRRAHMLRAIARLKPGVTRAEADAQLQTVVARLQREYPQTNATMGAAMMPLHDYETRTTRLPLLVLMASVGLLLLIACANVGNLLLVQALGREREASLRLALGASRTRIVRQLVAESVVVSGVGGAIGLFIGWIGTRALVRMQPEGLLHVSDFGVDLTVIAYVIAITLVSAVLFGVAPAVWARHRDPAVSLKDGGRSASTGSPLGRWADTLVIVEVALALLMATGGALLAKSYWGLRHVDLGFDPHDVVAVELGVGGKHYDTASNVDAFMTQLRQRARTLPGVTGVAIAGSLPLTGPAYTSDYTAFGRGPDQYGSEVGHRLVTPDYFNTMKVHLLRGRLLTEEDRLGAPLVVDINERLASSYFKGQDPIGQRIVFDKIPSATPHWRTIVGVVSNEHADGVDTPPRTEVYEAYRQNPWTRVHLLIRSTVPPASINTSVRALLRELDPKFSISILRTMDEMVDHSMALTRFLRTLMLGFAGIGLILSIVGVYGVLAHRTRSRMREMGIRIALGAQASNVRWLVVRRGVLLATLGLAGGIVLALAATPVIGKLLYDVQPRDPLVLTTVSALLAVTSVLAALLPAMRASRADPATILRDD